MEIVHPPVLDGILRAGKKPALADGGPLSLLIGTWIGSHGWNIIAVPGPDSSFKLLIRPYTEIITFTPVGAPVPDRGGTDTLLIKGVEYTVKVMDQETNQPLHLENGMWLLLEDQDTSAAFPIVRHTTVPHGNSVMALGTYSSNDGPPSIGILSALPQTGDPAPLGYTDPYLINKDIDVHNVNAPLQAIIDQQTIEHTVTLNVSTQNGGGIMNIPFIQDHANTTALESIFWIETIRNKDTGETYQQLQYTQQVDINFLPRFDDAKRLIMWPHTSVNTLVKQ